MGRIRAPLIKQHFISAAERPRVSETIPRQLPRLPYTAKFSGCERLDLIKKKKMEKFMLLEAIPIDLLISFFCHSHLKCFYSTQRR